MPTLIDREKISFISSHSRMTPLTSAVFNTIIATIMIIPPTANIGALLDYMSFANWTIYALTFIAIILFRFIEPYKSIPRPFKVIKIRVVISRGNFFRSGYRFL